MDENSANDANLSEIGRHIERIGSQLRKLPRQSDAYAQGLEDIEAYYERTVQLRQYTIDALRGDVADAQRRVAWLRNTAIIMLLVLAASCWAVAALNPQRG
jgi:uncharacterized protein (DUF3084 family)